MQGPTLERLSITDGDLFQARQYASSLLKHGTSIRETAEERVVQLALTTALVVAYGRPFSGNKDKSRKNEPKPDWLTELFSADELRLHARMLERRHKVFAHSDAGAFDVTVYTSGEASIPISRNPHIALEDAELIAVVSLIDKMSDRVRQLKGKLGL